VIQLEYPQYSHIFIPLTKETKDVVVVVVFGFKVVGPFTQKVGFVSGVIQ
jgi:hypothetical protein